MLKKFSISLIVVSTLVYGSIFIMSRTHNTSFFDEILIQLNRISTNINKGQEVKHSKLVLKTILENEHPTSSWSNLIIHNPQKNDDELFYHYKIWTIIRKLTLDDINDSYPIFGNEKKDVTIINMRYGKIKTVLQFPFFKTKEGNLIVGLFYPINERPISTDYNNDNKVDYEDVVLARKKG